MQKIADLKEDVKQKKVSFLAYLKGAYNLGFLGLLEVITFQNFAASPIPSPCGTLPLKKTESLSYFTRVWGEHRARCVYSIYHL